jgi:signal transduction histidine kinase
MAFSVSTAAAIGALTHAEPIVVVALAAVGALIWGGGVHGRMRHLERLFVAQIGQRDEGRRLETLGLAAAGIVHEMKNGLTVLKGFAVMAQKAAEGPDAERTRRGVAEVSLQATRVMGDLQQFLALADDPGSGAHRPVGEALADAVKLLAPIAHARGLSYESEIPDGLSRLVSEPDFRRAIVNLGLNAVAHAASRVLVGAQAANGGTVIIVEDDGAGIPPGQDALLFSTYVPGRRGGSGLGLHQVRQAVEKDGATLHHVATAPHGARFVIRLADAKPSQTPQPAPALPEPAAAANEPDKTATG